MRSEKRLVVGLSLGCRFGRELCAACFEPCVEFGGEAIGEVWGRRGEIVLFADVGVEIVEFEGVVVAESEEFEIAFADGAAEAVLFVEGVVGVVEAEGVSGEAQGFGEERQEALAVERVVRCWRQGGDVEEGWVAIHADDRRGIGGAGLDLTWPADDPWDADAAFVEHALDAAERAVVAVVAAVVRFEEDERVLAEAGGIEGGEEAADGGVHVLDHGGVDWVFDAGALAVFGDGFRARLHGVMD